MSSSSKIREDTQIIVLAAGKGTRMNNSALPKVMHPIADSTLLGMVMRSAMQVTDDITLVYSQELLPYLENYNFSCNMALQDNPCGTAHATYSARRYFNSNKITAILYGDHPLITPKIITDIVEYLQATNSAVMTLAFECDDPAQYGRIITDSAGNFVKIVEYKDADHTQQKIKLCNSGITCFAPGILDKYLISALEQADPSKEIYLTSLIHICSEAKEKVSYMLCKNAKAIVGVNTQQELEYAERILSSVIS